MSLTAGTLTVWRKPWRKQAFRRARHLISDQSPQPGQQHLVLAPAAPSSAASPPPGGCDRPPQAPPRARPAASHGSIAKASDHDLCAPGAAAIGGGE